MFWGHAAWGEVTVFSWNLKGATDSRGCPSSAAPGRAVTASSLQVLTVSQAHFPGVCCLRKAREALCMHTCVAHTHTHTCFSLVTRVLCRAWLLNHSHWAGFPKDYKTRRT